MIEAKLERVRIVSLDVSVVDEPTLISAIDDLRIRGGGYVCFSTVHMIMESYDDADYAANVNAADIVVPDGMPLVWMEKLLRHSTATRVRK